MKYTREQIKSAFAEWEKSLRLQPEDFMSEEDRLATNADEIAELNTLELLKYIKDNE